ncbi:MAG: hypothetical protein AAGF49_14765, partial [Pseudomonadota bacterium]
MATEPTRASEPKGLGASDAALTAVEEALKFDLDAPDDMPDLVQTVEADLNTGPRDLDEVAAERAQAADTAPTAEPDPLVPANDAPEAAPASRLRRRRHRVEARQQAAANDDRNRYQNAVVEGERRGTATFGLAIVASLVWAGLGALIFVVSATSMGFGAFFTSPAAFGILAATVAPILLFLMVATLARRADELRA